MPEVRYFSEDWMRRIERCVEKSESGFDATARRKRSIVGSGGGCESQNTIWDITVFGTPTGGTIVLPVTVNGVTTSITFNWNDSAATVKTTLAAGHSEIATTDLSTSGGPFPNATMRIEFIGTLASKLIPVPTVGFGSLTGGTGRGVIVAMAQRGHA